MWEAIQGWDYRMFIFLGFFLIIMLILFAAAVATFVGRERSFKQD